MGGYVILDMKGKGFLLVMPPITLYVVYETL